MNTIVFNEKGTQSMLIIGNQLRKRVTKDQHQDSDLTIALNDSQTERVRSHKFHRPRG